MARLSLETTFAAAWVLGSLHVLYQTLSGSSPSLLRGLIWAIGMISALCIIEIGRSHLAETRRFIDSLGLYHYKQWILLRDIRTVSAATLVVILILVVGLKAQFTILFLLVFGQLFVNVIKSLSPPNVLILHAFSGGQSLSEFTAGKFAEANVLSLYRKGTHISKPLLYANTYMAGAGARYSNDDQWREMVWLYMEWADALVFDLRTQGEGLAEELQMVRRSPTLSRKSIFVLSDSSQNSMLADDDTLESWAEPGSMLVESEEGKLLYNIRLALCRNPAMARLMQHPLPLCSWLQSVKYLSFACGGALFLWIAYY